MDTLKDSSPQASFIAGLLFGLLFLAIAGLFAWIFYSYFVSTTSKVAFMDEYDRLYIKDHGVIINKEIKDGTYNFVFTYPENQNSYRSVMKVTEREYGQSNLGDKVSIFYNPADPEKWLQPKIGKMGWGGFALIISFTITFLIGAVILFHSVRGITLKR
jgi:energy-coupling factor transporter transmembrane protein EcfT